MKSQGFALIYVLLILMLIGVTVFTVWSTGISDISMIKKTKNSAQTKLLAQNAIDKGWNEYFALVQGQTQTVANNTSIPNSAQACTPSGNLYAFKRYSASGSSPVLISANVTSSPTRTQVMGGVFDFRVCGSGRYIVGIGYSKGDKIVLRATIQHHDQYICPRTVTNTIINPVTGLPETITTTDFCGTYAGSGTIPGCNINDPGVDTANCRYYHDNDTLDISQTSY